MAIATMRTDLQSQLDVIEPAAITGSVVRTVGMTIAVGGFPAPIGSVAEIQRTSDTPLQGEVVGFDDHLTILYPYGDMQGIRRGNRVRLTRTERSIEVNEGLLGRVVNAHGEPLDSLPIPRGGKRLPLHQTPPEAISRPRIDQALPTGIRCIDGMLRCGGGQRMGIFAGSGVGKSVLLGMMARNTAADVNVIALIGERGREVNEFLERDLGPEGRRRSVVVVATSDQPAVMRVQAAQTATTIAEYFRDQNQNVQLMMDSLTRFALAQREIGLAAGEPPTTRGYPPSVFALLPRLVERAGRNANGSITAFYTVLVEGDDTNEPVSDCVRGLLDGHIILSRKIASQGHYPSIDILESISRLLPEITSPEHQEAVLEIRRLMSVYRDHEDLISIGAYRQGSNPEVDAAIVMRNPIHEFLRQSMTEQADDTQSCHQLLQLGIQCRAAREGNLAAAGTQPAPTR